MAHLGQVRDHQRIIESRGAKILAVSFGTPAEVEDYRAHFDVPFAMASDRDRALYRAYGLGQGSLLAVYGLAAIKQHVALKAQGFEPAPNAPKQDTLQLGGDFVIDASGRIAFAHPSRSGDDRAALADFVAALPAVAGAGR
jgi:peroxiredoxin